MKHYTIPVFVPELACPNRCVFCNQNSISGCHNQPSLTDVKAIIEERLITLPSERTHIEIGFFGGNFTGIDEALQKQYLSIARDYVIEKKVHGIRLSTRPDYITQESLKLLKEYGVTTIELGAQSLDEGVLRLAGRGHTVKDIETASHLILKNGFRLGLQMMTGLPGDTPEKSITTAKRIIELGAMDTRIYPTLVIKNTKLSELWADDKFHPQSLDDAVALSATLLTLFKDAGVNVIRVGLHPSDDLMAGNDFLAGPFHPSFRQLAETEIWRRKINAIVGNSESNAEISICVPAEEMNAAIGFEGRNRNMLLQQFNKVKFIQEESAKDDLPLIIADRRIPLPAKNALRNLGKLVLLEEDMTVYKSISSHPDIFICASANKVVLSPGIPEHTSKAIQSMGFQIIAGTRTPGKNYPDSAIYNCVITNNLLIHNLKITDPAILEAHRDKKHIHVSQGYTRCNLISLTDNRFITSDHGIERTLIQEGFEVLFVDPSYITLKGQKHGFFPGCCGLLNSTFLINGSLEFHPQGNEIRRFVTGSGLKVKELFYGRLTDAGSILSFALSKSGLLVND